MKTLFAVVLGVAMITLVSPGLGLAQSTCPAEVDQAKEMLSKKMASVKPEDVQAPRAMAGARQDVGAARGNQNVQAPRENQNVQAPRGNQDVQAPRGNQNVQAPRENQNVQAPRGNQDVQAPRGNQDVQAPRGNQDVQAPRAAAGATSQAQAPRSNLTKAASLVKEAEAACKAGNMPLASKKAKGAMALLK
jgi:hypothetical protein